MDGRCENLTEKWQLEQSWVQSPHVELPASCFWPCLACVSFPASQCKCIFAISCLPFRFRLENKSTKVPFKVGLPQWPPLTPKIPIQTKHGWSFWRDQANTQSPRLRTYSPRRPFFCLQLLHPCFFASSKSPRRLPCLTNKNSWLRRSQCDQRQEFGEHVPGICIFRTWNVDSAVWVWWVWHRNTQLLFFGVSGLDTCYRAAAPNTLQYWQCWCSYHNGKLRFNYKPGTLPATDNIQ